MKKKHLLASSVLFVFIFFVYVSNTFSQVPQYYNYQNVGSSNNNFPFNVTAGKEVQWLVGPGELNAPGPAPAGNITKIYFYTVNTGTATYTNITIKLGQGTTITTLPTGVFYTGDLDTVYYRASGSLTGPAAGWMVLTLDTPFPYNPAQSLIIDVGQCSHSGAGPTVRQNSITGSLRRNYSVGGCPFVYSGQDANVVNFGVDITPVTNTPNRCMYLPVPGVNTNYVSVPYQASMVGFQNITIEAWVKCGGSTTANTVLNKGAASFDYQLGINATTLLPFFRAGTTIVSGTGITMPVGIWTHLAVTWDGTTVKFYKDGVMASSTASALTLGSSANEIRIGRGNADAGSGGLDEIRVWSIARTQPDISANMCNKWVPNNTAGLKAKWHMDSTFTDSVNGWNGTAMGTVTFDTATVCTPVAINPIGNLVPSIYALWQNYPNPFNPATVIKFSLPKDGYVEIDLFDITGRKISTLVSDPYKAGTYSFEFNAANLASGVYFYTLKAGNFTDTKKMVLIK